MEVETRPIDRQAIWRSQICRAGACDPAGEYVDDEGHVDHPCPCRHIGHIGDPELVRRLRDELPVDLVIRARLRWIGDGCLLLSTHNPLQAVKMHEPLHSATRDVVPVATESMPDFAGTVAPPALAVGRLDLLEVHSVLPGAVRGKLGIARDSGMAMEGCRGDRRNTADRAAIVARTNGATMACPRKPCDALR